MRHGPLWGNTGVTTVCRCLFVLVAGVTTVARAAERSLFLLSLFSARGHAAGPEHDV